MWIYGFRCPTAVYNEDWQVVERLDPPSMISFKIPRKKLPNCLLWTSSSIPESHGSLNQGVHCA